MYNELTRRGIANNLDISPYTLIVDYDNESLEYVFSSQRYKDDFYNKYIDNRIKINESLSNRFKMNIEFDKLCDLVLYSKIEKRGFLIKGKEEYRCLSNIRLSGANLMTVN